MRAFLGIICIIGLSQAYPTNDFTYTSSTSNQLGGLNAYLPPGSPGTGDYNQGGGYEAPLISKHFYIHSAPEEEENLQPKRFLLGRPQKNYRVVFIRAPSASKQRFAAEFAPNEEKTVIYVLAQKEHEIDPSDIATPAPTEPSKPEVFFIKYKTPEEAVHAQQQIQDGWRALRDGKGLQTWDYRKALIHVQSIYGAFPFFKISVGKRFTPPYGNIIVLKEGETGLPHKVFYNLDPTNKIVHAYKMLLRDFALNMGVIGEESELFADEIFHYEKRIVNQIMLTEKSTHNGVNQITTLGELKKLAPSLPVFEAMQAIFSKTKITEETEVLVENVNVIQEMSIIVSTSDKQPLNDFIIWAVARKLLPYLSREYNVLVEKFEQELFGGKLITPKWFFCTKVIQNMMTFAIDALQENTTRISISTDTERRKHALERKILLGDELFKLIFYHIRNELQSHLEHAAEIREPKRTLIMEKLSSIKLQIGLPDAALETAEYVNKYYEAFLLQNLFFAEHLESFWNFKRVRMENSLKPLRLVDLIIAELYSSVKLPRIAFSPSMNMAIITRRHLQASYFNYKYPISINFARIGSDIAQFFLEATSFYLHEERINSTSPLEQIFNLKCLKKVTEYQNSTLSTAAVMKLYNKISAAKLTSKAFKTFLNVIENAEPIVGKVISEVTYEDLGLVKKRRQPGLRHLNEEQLFSLALLQNHCSVSNDVINNFKQFIENEVPENKTFYALWNYVPYVSGSLYCPTERRRCFRIL